MPNPRPKRSLENILLLKISNQRLFYFRNIEVKNEI